MIWSCFPYFLHYKLNKKTPETNHKPYPQTLKKCIIQQIKQNLKFTHRKQTHKSLNLCSQILFYFPIFFSKWINWSTTILVVDDRDNIANWTLYGQRRWGNRSDESRGREECARSNHEKKERNILRKILEEEKETIMKRKREISWKRY